MQVLVTIHKCGSANAFDHVHLCPSVYPVHGLTLESLDVETSFLVYEYICSISRSIFYVKVTRAKNGMYKSGSVQCCLVFTLCDVHFQCQHVTPHRTATGGLVGSSS